MIAATSTKNSPYILGFFDRWIQRFKKIIDCAWIIPNPHNFTFNITQKIVHEIQVSTTKADIYPGPTNFEAIEDPKIVQKIIGTKEKAEKIHMIANQLFDIRILESKGTKSPSLTDCIQQVCSYAFTGWVLDSEKNEISQKIDTLLSEDATKKSEASLEKTSTREGSEIGSFSVETRPHFLASETGSEVLERNSFNQRSQSITTTTEENNLKTDAIVQEPNQSSTEAFKRKTKGDRKHFKPSHHSPYTQIRRKFQFGRAKIMVLFEIPKHT